MQNHLFGNCIPYSGFFGVVFENPQIFLYFGRCVVMYEMYFGDIPDLISFFLPQDSILDLWLVLHQFFHGNSIVQKVKNSIFLCFFLLMVG